MCPNRQVALKYFMLVFLSYRHIMAASEIRKFRDFLEN